MINIYKSFREKINFLEFGGKSYHQRRLDNDDRWEFLQPHLENKHSCLDIGCASGYLTRKCADEGLLTLGIDDLSQSDNRLQNAISEYGYTQNIGFGNWKVSPNNVNVLPKFDCILAMTVYHHFIKTFGKEHADRIMEKLYGKCDILVVEFPGWRWTGRSLTVEMISEHNGEVFKLNNHEQLSPYGVRIRPILNKYVNPGKYRVTIHAEGYNSSNTLNIDINSTDVHESSPRIKFEGEQVQLLPGNEVGSEIGDVVEWYDELVKEIFPDSTTILDKTLVDYFGDREENIIYILK